MTNLNDQGVVSNALLMLNKLHNFPNKNVFVFWQILYRGIYQLRTFLILIIISVMSKVSNS